MSDYLFFYIKSVKIPKATTTNQTNQKTEFSTIFEQFQCFFWGGASRDRRGGHKILLFFNQVGFLGDNMLNNIKFGA